MRIHAARLAVALLFVTACGDDDGPQDQADARPQIDARPGADGSVPSSSCAAPIALSDGSTVSGDNTGMGSNIDGLCSLEFSNGGAPEAIYLYTPPVSGELQVRMSSAADLAVYARTTCTDAATELA